MANTMYPLGIDKFLAGSISWTTNDIKVCGVTSGYTYSAAHDYLDDITNIVFTTANLATKSVSSGAAIAADVTTAGVTGSAVAKLIVYKDTGVAGTSPLICCFDTATGLPFTPNGGSVTLDFDQTNGVFKIT